MKRGPSAKSYWACEVHLRLLSVQQCTLSKSSVKLAVPRAFIWFQGIRTGGLPKYKKGSHGSCIYSRTTNEHRKSRKIIQQPEHSKYQEKKKSALKVKEETR